ncbi:MAG TPA: phosphoribosylaminoimidazolecarboxamide formyltransferase [Acidimicrobiia bacterium]
MDLRYGINPEQAARASLGEPGSPLRLVSGEPSYINLLDALNAWQLVREAARSLEQPVATSFKHVSPAGVAAAGELDEVMEATWAVRGAELTPAASAYVRARDCDPKSSFGDFVAASEPVDQSLATLLASVVSDGIVAPGFEPGTVEVLAAKKDGRFLVLEATPDYQPPEWERRDVFGLWLEQRAARAEITPGVVSAGTSTPLPDAAVADLVLAMVTARYTQSNSMIYAKAGMVVGVGAGQQSRVDCTKLAGAKIDTWWLRRHDNVRSLAFKSDVRRQDRINWQIRHIEGDMTSAERERFLDAVHVEPAPLTAEDRASWLAGLEEVALASDGYIPFRDNIDHAARHGVRYVAHPGGSTRSDEVRTAAAEHGITMANTGVPLFHH